MGLGLNIEEELLCPSQGTARAQAQAATSHALLWEASYWPLPLLHYGFQLDFQADLIRVRDFDYLLATSTAKKCKKNVAIQAGASAASTQGGCASSCWPDLSTT